MAIIFVDRDSDQQKKETKPIRVTEFGHYHLTDEWRNWIRHSLDQGDEKNKIFTTAFKHNLDPCSLALELGGFEHTGLDHSQIQFYKKGIFKTWASAPLIEPTNLPRAWKVDSPLLQLYEISDFLSREECDNIIDTIDTKLVQSTVTTGKHENFRTSRTCSLTSVDPYTCRTLDQKISSLVGAHPSMSDKIEGVRYDEGQYFKAHYDWFLKGESYYENQTNIGGQRTWTIMIFLNFVEEGGETMFTHLGKKFTPIPGTALCWNNLYYDGTPNKNTMHEALPVIKGSKYVITKWFREAAGKNEY